MHLPEVEKLTEMNTVYYMGTLIGCLIGGAIGDR